MYNIGNKSFTELEGEYDVSKATMSRWIKKISPVNVFETETITMKEYQALQKKIRELELENEILKKLQPYLQKNYRRSYELHQ
ncbi:hypothetical protein [Clostridium algidicarnis]|uniref:hypothetical protein n=1 Tax=Clostridium algidicarnis TaxID=37659 RepID=UPI00209ABE92|nr:hypothetical protein [Clostridium algidicarnis]